jgi:hypothetical protein
MMSKKKNKLLKLRLMKALTKKIAMMEQEKGSVTNFLVMISKILKEIPN